jgi:D-3-phosphoglycerate dehydrogenase / 2-oxoglutarate reductase
VSARILVVGDGYMPPDAFAPALQAVGLLQDVEFQVIDDSRRPELPGLREYQGSPEQIDGWLDGHSVLCVHAAPVTRELLAANPSVRIVACARGGPVNIDLAAAADLGVTVTTTPAKNAPSVADLTISMVIMLLRRMLPAALSLRDQAAQGVQVIDSTFSGSGWMASEPRGRTLGLIGVGAIARLVAPLATALGMEVVGYDPYAPPTVAEFGIKLVSLEDLLASADVVSLHARATGETYHLINEVAIAAMRPGALLINTSRQSLVDEKAMLDGLESGRLGGAAMDVCEPDGLWNRLVLRDDVIITPHIGGATFETRDRGAAMVAGEISRFLGGQPPRNPASLG